MPGLAGIIPAKGLSPAQQFLPSLIMGVLQGLQKRRVNDYENQLLPRLMAGESLENAMVEPPAQGILNVLGRTLGGGTPPISRLSPFTQKVIEIHMPKPPDPYETQRIAESEAREAAETKRANAATVRVIPGDTHYWRLNLLTGENTKTDIPVKTPGLFSDPVTAGPDDSYAPAGTTYQFGPDKQMRVISKPTNPLNDELTTQRIDESKTREAALTKRLVPGDEYYFSVDTVTGETVQTKARVPVKDKGRFSDPVTAAENDPYGVPAGTTYQFGPDNQMRTISKPAQPKTEQKEPNRRVSSSELTNYRADVLGMLAKLPQRGPAAGNPFRGPDYSMNDILSVYKSQAAQRQYPFITENERQQYNAAFENTVTQNSDYEWEPNTWENAKAEARQQTTGRATEGQTRYQPVYKVMRNPTTGKSVGWDGSKWVLIGPDTGNDANSRTNNQ